MSTCPIHRALAKLRVFAGLPVPHSVKWIDGKPDFRQTDTEKWKQAVVDKLCGVCGEPLEKKCYWIGATRSYKSGFFTDLPMHRACAKESIRLCPFLNGTRQHYRGDDLRTLPHMVVGPRPETMLLMQGLTRDLSFADLDGYIALYAGANLTIVRTF